jgi:chaperonin cofactor prefoldin
MSEKLGTHVSGASIPDAHTRRAFGEQEQINRQLLQSIQALRLQIQTLQSRVNQHAEALAALNEGWCMATTETILSLSSTDLDTLVTRVNTLTTAFNTLRSDFNTFRNEILDKIDGSGTGGIPTFTHSATFLDNKSILEVLQDLDASVAALWSSQNSFVATRAIGALNASATSNAEVSGGDLSVSAETKTALTLGEDETVPVLGEGETVVKVNTQQLARAQKLARASRATSRRVR